MAKLTLKGAQAIIDELSIKLKASIARENALRAKLEKVQHPQAFSNLMNMTNPAFKAKYDELRTAHPTGLITKQQVVEALDVHH